MQVRFMVLPASIYNSLFPKIVVCGSVNNMYTSIYSIVKCKYRRYYTYFDE